jgi:hypothetical protein
MANLSLLRIRLLVMHSLSFCPLPLHNIYPSLCLINMSLLWTPCVHIYVCFVGVAAFSANSSAAKGPTKKLFRGTRSGTSAEMQRTTFGVCPFRGLGRGSKNRAFLVFVCVYVCIRLWNPIDFLLYRTAHGFWVKKFFWHGLWIDQRGLCIRTPSWSKIR